MFIPSGPGADHGEARVRQQVQRLLPLDGAAAAEAHA
jgi:hypothetical protein